MGFSLPKINLAMPKAEGAKQPTVKNNPAPSSEPTVRLAGQPDQDQLVKSDQPAPIEESPVFIEGFKVDLDTEDGNVGRIDLSNDPDIDSTNPETGVETMVAAFGDGEKPCIDDTVNINLNDNQIEDARVMFRPDASGNTVNINSGDGMDSNLVLFNAGATNNTVTIEGGEGHPDLVTIADTYTDTATTLRFDSDGDGEDEIHYRNPITGNNVIINNGIPQVVEMPTE